MGVSDDDFDSGDALFDDVDEDDLIFDGVEEAELISKTPGKHSRENDTPAFDSVKKARHGSVSTTKGHLGEAQRIQIARKILLDNFRYASFRHEQEAAISRILGGDNALVVFPTGAGKSLCYQVCRNLITICFVLTIADSCHRLPRDRSPDQ